MSHVAPSMSRCHHRSSFRHFRRAYSPKKYRHHGDHKHYHRTISSKTIGMKPLVQHYKDVSLPHLLQTRRQGIISSALYENYVLGKQSNHLALLTNRAAISTQTTSSPLSSLDLSYNDRFLLSANESGGIFLYDLSKWGLSPVHNPPSYAPVGQIQTRGGACMNRAVWHGKEAIVFITASADGRVGVWDANLLQQVYSMRPFPKRQAVQSADADAAYWPISSMDKNSHAADQMIVTSTHDPCVKLVDLRTGGCSHSLLGHARGCTVVRWSPQSPYCLASGDKEGMIRIWDIRKASSCLTVLQRDENRSPDDNRQTLRRIRAHYEHLKRGNKAKSHQQKPIQPQHTIHSSHTGPIEQLAFDPTGQYLVSLSNMTLSLWDMLHKYPFVPRRYMSITSSTPSQRRPVILTPNGQCDYIIWVGDKRLIKGYSLLNGGKPLYTLKGHMGDINDVISKGTELLSTAKDYVILQWGQDEVSRKRKSLTVDRDCW
jgi:WD40 repeat protein